MLILNQNLKALYKHIQYVPEQARDKIHFSNIVIYNYRRSGSRQYGCRYQIVVLKSAPPEAEAHYEKIDQNTTELPRLVG